MRSLYDGDVYHEIDDYHVQWLGEYDSSTRDIKVLEAVPGLMTRVVMQFVEDAQLDTKPFEPEVGYFLVNEAEEIPTLTGLIKKRNREDNPDGE